MAIIFIFSEIPTSGHI